jgi:hypothetical protein
MLRELTLAYDIPQQTLGKVFRNRIKGLGFNVTGSNLVYFSGYSGNFPEVGGFDQGRYPLPRRLTFGLRATL